MGCGIRNKVLELTGTTIIVSRGECKEETGGETEAREALLRLHQV